MAFLNVISLLLIATFILETNASRLKGTYLPAYGLPTNEMNSLTLTKYPDTSEIGCARLCSRYPGCTSFTLAPGLCTLMTARHNVRREQGGADFYLVKEIEPSYIQEAGRVAGTPFNLSSAYYASYHPISRIRLYYDDNSTFITGLEVKHGSDVARTGYGNRVMEECQLMEGEFIQRWEYSIYLYRDFFPVIGCNTLVTAHKTCGPYGSLCGSMHALEGYRLLYIAGRNGAGFDQLSLGFDSC